MIVIALRVLRVILFVLISISILLAIFFLIQLNSQSVVVMIFSAFICYLIAQLIGRTISRPGS